MASKKNNKKQAVEVAGIILIGFSIFLLWCLINYDPRDPSFETGVSAIPRDLWKRGGLFGSYMASFLFQVMGLGAFVVPAAVFLISIKLLFRPLFPLLFYVRSFLYFLIFLCGESFLSLYVGKLVLAKYKFNAGGALAGELLSGMLTRYVGKFGAYLVTVLAFLLVVMVLTEISYVRIWTKVVDPLGARIRDYIKSQLLRFKKTPATRLMEKNRSTALSAEKRSVNGQAEGNSELPAANLEAVPELDFEKIPINVLSEKKSKKILSDDEDMDFQPAPVKQAKEYVMPPLMLLDTPTEQDIQIDRDALRRDAETLTQKLADFGVMGTIVEISPGPVITRFEFEPAPGIKLNRIISLSDDLALALKAISVRIAPIPGKSVVGIELPNKKRKAVFFKDIVSQEEFFESPSRLTIGLGKDIAGMPIISDLSRMPHLLVAGTTGSGKSVFVNTVICSMMFKATPAEVRFLMIDPKRLELSPYEGIPHLLHPVVVEPKKAAIALRWAVEEMERRYKRIAEKGTRNIIQYNKKLDEEAKNGEQFGEGHD